MKRRYLKDVTTLPDYILQVDFVSGSRLLLDMKPYLDKIRFLSLADKNVWSSAVTNGIFVRFGDVELSHDVHGRTGTLTQLFEKGGMQDEKMEK